MPLFETVKDMGHEQVLFCHGKNPPIKAIIAIHNTSLGPAMGATRLYPYVSEEDALTDVLRLSRGMTYKAACANIPMGGGKAVIIAHPQQKTPELLKAYAGFINNLNGQFITGQDINLTPEDVRVIREQTKYVVGGEEKSGGPAPITALGVFLGIKAAVQAHWQSRELQGLKVAIQGLGNVGKNLCRYLHEHKIKLYVSDVDPAKTAEMQQLFNATVVSTQEIYSQDVDIFAPCALGGIINQHTIPQLKAKIIAGAANNQLADEKTHSQMLTEKGITYCPDYVINAGGLINVYNEMIGYEDTKVMQQVHQIYDTLLTIFDIAKRKNITTNEAAQQLAEYRIINTKKNQIINN